MNAKDKIGISVVVCSYNRDKFIKSALNCLANQTLSASVYEIVIIDNMSTDNTSFLCKEFIKDNPSVNVRYFLETNKGLSFARNRGVKEAYGDIIAFVDDDAEASREFLKSIVDFAVQNDNFAGFGGKVIPKYEGGKEPEWMNKYLNGFVGKVDHGDKPLLYTKKMKYPVGCNMAYTRKILQEAGGFNNQLTFRSDDKYIFHEVVKINSRVFYLPEAIVYHNIDASRVTFENFRKLFLKTGNEEKIRLRSKKNAVKLVWGFFSIAFKVAASLLLYAFFAIKGQAIKGKYVFYAQWFTLKGFLQKEVFVR